jgi:hypothetical protein
LCNTYLLPSAQLCNKYNTMNPFKQLSAKENEVLLNYPAYISLLAANGDGIFDEAEKKTAIEFAHLKTYSTLPALNKFYQEVDRVFKDRLEALDQQLPKDKVNRDIAIKKELKQIEKINLKLGKMYSSIMHDSMKSFQEHVLKAHHSVLVDFIIPLTVPGLTEG